MTIMKSLWEWLFAYTTIFICCYSIPFVDPLVVLELKAYLLFVLGCGGLYLLFKLGPHKLFSTRASRTFGALILTYVTACFVATALAPNVYRSLFGSQYFRLGLVSIVASIVVGLVVASRLRKYHLVLFYKHTVIASTIAVALDISSLLNTERLTGWLGQSSLTALVAATGLILGQVLPVQSKTQLTYRVASQLWLITVVVACQSRAIIALTLLAIVFTAFNSPLFMELRRRLTQASRRVLVGGLCLSATLMLIWLGLGGTRVIDLNYYKESFSYRADLIRYGYDLVKLSPVLGWGMENMPELLLVHGKPSAAIVASYNDGYYVASTHNIYWDRAIEIGILGALSYIGAITLSVWQAIKRRSLVLEHGLLAVLLLVVILQLAQATYLESTLLLWILVAFFGINAELRANRTGR